MSHVWVVLDKKIPGHRMLNPETGVAEHLTKEDAIKTRDYWEEIYPQKIGQYSVKPRSVGQ